ncbi:MAG: NTP transferase domain-containing protein [Ignavibacteria bacterium]|jgi:NDP-sugar pyrophosphorylase family protein|nr:NTP transferase domain-containing protein [Ignavibacteria bacterium]MCU7503893.1 NTP transferase domain-containing protein [Ignavibacteria bacterium]MCU7515886.1 NTP transferase domain-containing protein [Ignavibacteria bacterium]
MNLAILAAGESSRLKAEGLKVPKPLITINGETIIERIIRLGLQNGAASIYCIINEEELLLREFFISGDFEVPVKLVIRTTESSMHSLFSLAPYLTDEPFLLTTCDSVFDALEFRNFVSSVKNSTGIQGTLAVTQYIDDEKPLCVKMDSGNKITAFSDRQEGYLWATGGIYYFSPEIFEMIKAAHELKISRLRNFLRLLLSNGYSLKGFPFSKIIDVDHLKDIKAAEEYLCPSEKPGA